MRNYKGLLDKNKLILYLFIIAGCFALFTKMHQEPQVSIKPVKLDKMSELEHLAKDNAELKQRLAKLEPPSPVKIVSSAKAPGSYNDLSVIDVVAEGTRVPFKTVYKDVNWIRPDYVPYWHSKSGVAGSIPDRIHNSYHRLFATVGNNGLWNETMHNSGIVEISEKFRLPVFGNNPDNTLVAVIFQHNVTDVVSFNNQVVLLGTPMRTGVQVIAVDRRDLFSSGSEEVLSRNKTHEYLFQLSTPDGYELDFNNVIISY